MTDEQHKQLIEGLEAVLASMRENSAKMDAIDKRLEAVGNNLGRIHGYFTISGDALFRPYERLQTKNRY
jgi:hypothetical protein